MNIACMRKGQIARCPIHISSEKVRNRGGAGSPWLLRRYVDLFSESPPFGVQDQTVDHEIILFQQHLTRTDLYQGPECNQHQDPKNDICHFPNKRLWVISPI